MADDPESLGDHSENDNVIAAFVRAAARLRGFARLPRRLPTRSVAKATDRLSTLIDISESIAAKGGLRTVLGGSAWAFAKTGGSVTLTLLKATLAGTILFSAFSGCMVHGGFLFHARAPLSGVNTHEESDRMLLNSLLLPCTAGAFAGACYGGTVVVLDHMFSINRGLSPLAVLVNNFRFIRQRIPSSMTYNAIEWSCAFGCYFALKRAMGIARIADTSTSNEDPGGSTLRLASERDRGAPEDGPQALHDIISDNVVAMSPLYALKLAAAAIGGGAAQVSVATVIENGFSFRGLSNGLTVRSIGVAAIGLAAFDLAEFIE